MENDLASQYYSPKGYWKGFGAIKKLAEAAKVSEDVAKQWLFKQGLWQIYLPALDVPTPNAVYQADLLFLPDDNLPPGRKVYKYVLTVVDVASRYKEAKTLTSNELFSRFTSAEADAQALTRPQVLQADPGSPFMGSVTKEMENHKHIFAVGTLKFTETKLLWSVLTARSLSACSVISMTWKCSLLLTGGRLCGSTGFLALLAR